MALAKLLRHGLDASASTTTMHRQLIWKDVRNDTSQTLTMTAARVINSDVDGSDALDMSDFERVESENDDDLHNFSNEAAYQDNTSESEGKHPIYGACLLADRIGAEGPVFRLLSIKPAQSELAEVYCDLVRRPLYEADSHYSALSYSWGRDLRLDTIYIGRLSREFRITRHLLRALRRLRHATAPVCVWVDAICIDQMDLEEKAAQIPLIAQIFNQAKEVVIWLGDRIDYEPVSLVGLGYEPTNWSKRLWVVQETLYAAVEPVVLLGPRRVPMSSLLESWHPVHDSAFVDAVARRPRAGNLDEVQVAVRLARECFDHMRQLYDAWVEQSTVGIVRKPLIDWVHLTTRRRCKEPVDRVYALLNLIPEREARHLQPDYRKSLESLLNDTVHYYLSYTSWSLPELQQLLGDLGGGQFSDLDWMIVQEPINTPYELLASPDEPRRASDHVFWRFTSLDTPPTLVMAQVISDRIWKVLCPSTVDELICDMRRYSLSRNEDAIKQALRSYLTHPKHFLAGMHGVAPSQVHQASHRIPASTVHPFQTRINAEWQSYLGIETRSLCLSAIIVTVSGIVGIQLPSQWPQASKGDKLYFTESGLGHVARAEELKTMCFVPKTEHIEAFFARRNKDREFFVEISLPRHARITTEPPSVLL